MTQRLGKNQEQVMIGLKIWNTGMELQHPLFELEEKGKYKKKAKYCRHHQLEDANYSTHPHNIKSCAHY
jgi:hypothetical protein